MECGEFSNIVDYYGASSSFVMSSCDCLISFLACSVPDLCFDHATGFKRDVFRSEFDSDGGIMNFGQSSFDVARDDVSFADSGVSDEDDYKGMFLLKSYEIEVPL